MRLPRATANDPVEIGVCAGCGQPIYSNEDYWLTSDGEYMIHAEGVGARGKTCGENPRSVTMSCLGLYIRDNCEEELLAKLLDIVRVNA